jgi:hypothetical protein
VEAERLEREVSRLVPDVVSSVERETPVAGLADVRRALGTLRSEQARLRRELESMEQRLRATPREGGHRP